MPRYKGKFCDPVVVIDGMDVGVADTAMGDGNTDIIVFHLWGKILDWGQALTLGIC